MNPLFLFVLLDEEFCVKTRRKDHHALLSPEKELGLLCYAFQKEAPLLLHSMLLDFTFLIDPYALLTKKVYKTIIAFLQ